METILVGIIGFAGVMITLWYNGKLAREQREEERNNERKTLRAGLIEELKINRTGLRENADRLEKDPPKEGGGVYVPTDSMEDVYLSVVAKIGLLSEVEVGRVINAYLSLRTYRANMFLIGVQDDRVPRHVQVPEENIAMLTELLESVLGLVDEAISALEDAE